MKKIFFVLSLFLSLCACERKTLKDVTVKTSNGDVVYHLEIADTDEKRIKGLMYREHLASDSGMIFFFNDKHPQPIAMWMKNTYISLDMLFLSKQNTIIGIAENTTPMSLKIISPTKEYVAAVVELNAGQIKKHGIKKGDKVIY
ncbi:MAG: DUF192 domain-containing protein [Alphaproteobacteria bacterium]|nr:DUF192 domain-containing protein [Alphaproteobacteria bacterium]